MQKEAIGDFQHRGGLICFMFIEVENGLQGMQAWKQSWRWGQWGLQGGGRWDAKEWSKAGCVL